MKKVKNNQYVHAAYADKHFAHIEGFSAAKEKAKEFTYTIVKYCTTTGDFSFTFSPDFDTADEPLVSDSLLVKADGSVKFFPQQNDPFIYHSKHLFVEADYVGFDFAAARDRSKLIDSIPNLDKTRIGRLSYWQENVLPILAKMANTLDSKTIGQYLVSFAEVTPAVKTPRFAQYILTKREMEGILLHWTKQTWELKTGGQIKSVAKNCFHPTARDRYALTVPIAKYLENNKPAASVLYHGVGRDSLGAQTLKADCYDPFHPNVEVRAEPRKQYDEIHSHYTLNVVTKEEGLEILRHIHSLLKAHGKAVISVRRDFNP